MGDSVDRGGNRAATGTWETAWTGVATAWETAWTVWVRVSWTIGWWTVWWGRAGGWQWGRGCGCGWSQQQGGSGWRSGGQPQQKHEPQQWSRQSFLLVCGAQWMQSHGLGHAQGRGLRYQQQQQLGPQPRCQHWHKQ